MTPHHHRITRSRLSPRDTLHLGLVGLRIRKARAVLSALGISIGIATLIVVIGLPASSERALMKEMEAMGTNMLRAQPRPDQQPPVKLAENAVGSVERIGPVTQASAVANTHALVRRSDRVDENDAAGLTVLAAGLDLLDTVGAKLGSGRFLDKAAENFPTAVLGHQAAARLGVGEPTPGQRPPQVRIGQEWFTVIGVLAPVRLASDLDQSVLVGWEAAQARLGFDGHPTVVYVRAKEAAVEDVRAVLGPTLNPERPGLVQVSRPSDALAAKRATESTFSALFLGLAGVALLVGGIGVANTMVISVLERRKEIGLRRALGANSGQIRTQFLTESVALSGLGGVAGALLGTAATVGFAAAQGWQPVIPAGSVAAGIGAAVVVGAMAGVYPSVRAARLTPVEALAGS
ncbi:ABC transporter permease [Streptomyces gamaensis]|uniref:ABC transporter permease n=1 Tax=Streptomyces gamaensis TaxID=1763542 RepID=A0ABW0ZAL7_9ACTN